MAVTSQQIAELAGVSRGTVDRALHNRGRVNPEVAARILQIAEELGYRPNSIGQALARTRQNIRLGAILQSAETPTMQDIAAEARQAAAELRGSGLEVELREIQGRDTLRVLQQISELMDWGASGLAIASNNTPDLVQRINEISNQGVPVVTFNTDAPDSRRLCFVGMDNYRAGQTAAGLIRQMLPGGGLVLPIAGHVNNGAHINRLRGFLDTLEDTGDIQLLSFQLPVWIDVAKLFFQRLFHFRIIDHFCIPVLQRLSGKYPAGLSLQLFCQHIFHTPDFHLYRRIFSSSRHSRYQPSQTPGNSRKSPKRKLLKSFLRLFASHFLRFLYFLLRL